ncbi:MAG: 3'-5' exonuclease [Pirellulaceae bacterium]|nr:3'-5' exonuclease [Pirellulaceae bacterium]
MNESITDERLVFLDLEVGGEESWRPIFEIAAIAVDSNLRELETFDVRLKFATHMADPKVLVGSRYATPQWKRRAICATDAGDEFADFLRRHATVDQTSASGRVFQVAQLVAHNADFDRRFLEHWFAHREQFLPASPRMLCTLQRAMWLFHENKSLTPPLDFKLGTLCEYFGVSLAAKESHQALFDVRATVQLYREMNQAWKKPRHLAEAQVCSTPAERACAPDAAEM